MDKDKPKTDGGREHLKALQHGWSFARRADTVPPVIIEATQSGIDVKGMVEHISVFVDGGDFEFDVRVVECICMGAIEKNRMLKQRKNVTDFMLMV